MPLRFHHAALVGKYQTQGIGDVLEKVARFLVAQGLKVSLELDTAANTGLQDYPALTHAEIGARCDLAVVIGGDGTMLGSARQLASSGIALVGINQGRLGFITDVPLGQFAEALEPMLGGEFQEECRTMLEGGVWRDGQRIADGFAVNDVVVSRGSNSSMVELKVEIGHEFIGNFRADGLIIGSPTGSTAYALSAGGPILHPGIQAWVMVPIAPHDLSNRPIVLPDTSEITIEVVAGREASVNFDMQGMADLVPGDRILLRRSPHQVRFLHPSPWSYYDTLRRKLRWNAGLT